MVLICHTSLLLLIARAQVCLGAGSGGYHDPWQAHHNSDLIPAFNELPSLPVHLEQPDNPLLPYTHSHIQLSSQQDQPQQQLPLYEGYPIPDQDVGLEQQIICGSSDATACLPTSHLYPLLPARAHDPSNLAAYAASMREYSEQYPLAMSSTIAEPSRHQIRTGIPRKRSVRPGRGRRYIDSRASLKRKQAKGKMPTAEDEEEEEEESQDREGEGRGEGEESHVDLNDQAIPPEARMKRAVRALWNRKGLWVGMPVKELVTGITEIKLELGGDNSHSIGLIIGVMLRLKRPGDAYLHQIQDQTRKISKRIKKLNRKFDKDSAARAADGSEEEREEKRREMIYLYCRFLRSREEYRQSFKNEYNDPSDETRINREAHRAWGVLVFLGVVPAAGAETNDQEEEGGLPMRKIEQASRSIEFLLSPYTREDVADFLRFYMAKEFHQSPAQIDVFNKARNEWLKRRQLV